MWAMRLCVVRSSKTRTLKSVAYKKKRTLEIDPRTTVLTHIFPGYEHMTLCSL